MCGISASIINLKSNKGRKININSLIKNLNDKKLNNTYEKVKSLRSHYYYNEIFFKKEKYINTFKLIQDKLDKIKNIDNSEIIDDILWILNEELLNTINKIEKIISDNNLKVTRNLIIFLRHLLCEIDNINYLETRGRDSASLSISLISKDKIIINGTINNNKRSLSISKNVRKNAINITIKYAKKIGYSGENSKNIINNLLKSNLLSKINFKKIKKVSFISHTRWATVGKINKSNCHPLIIKEKNDFNFFSMNGDITNYFLLKKKFYNKKIIDKNCTNDLVVLNEIFKKKKISILEGSFVILKHKLEKADDLFISKKGSQGLYFSKDYDQNHLISSDVYGLVNRIDKFNIIKNNSNFYLSKIFKTTNSEFKKITKTNLSSKDLSKKNYETYFLKEINDTNNFIKKTIVDKINFKKNEINNFINLDKKLQKKIINNKIKNIILTGMGSCYTAAVGISKYIGSLINKNNIQNIKVEATVASEGSAFYLKNDMRDSIVIVLAQSGTTIDTNVFARMSRERGAYTIAIVNKKQGDITYIVNKNIYLGNGRDVELSVPSTKTYTCHLIMGFILAEKIIKLFFKNGENKFCKNLNNIVKNNFIDKSIKRIEEGVKKISVDPTFYKNWVVVYDDSINAFSALEYRIKLSECCYKSIPYYHIEQFNKSKFNNCLIFYVGDQFNKIYHNKTNLIIAISNLSKNKIKGFVLKIKSKEFIKKTIEITLAIQLVAYNTALKIDKLSKNKIVFSKKNIKFTIDDYKIKSFNKNNLNMKNNILIERLKRPIDSIKHQAKTITVGALRNNLINKNYYKVPTIYTNLITESNYLGKFKELKNNIFIRSDNNNEIYKYYLGNIIEKCNNLYSTDKSYFFCSSNNIKTQNIDSTYINFGHLKNRKKEKQINLYKNSYHELLKKFLVDDNFSRINEFNLNNIKNYILKNKKEFFFDINKTLNNFNNIKFLGSGINYLVAKQYSFALSKEFNRTIAFDVIENHKHIDTSSEALLIIFLSNINKYNFQIDALSEIEKFVSHENKVIIFSNLENTIFDRLKLNKNILRIIKFPYINSIYSPIFFEFYLNNLIKKY
jgi:glucosamine 6-phosphate synthetase-like amidotransferase/phosphosugar isomerase protein